MRTEDDLRRELSQAVRRNGGDGLLLSGGLDSSIIAYYAPQAKAITVSLEGRGQDRECAALVARHLGMSWHPVNVTTEEAIAALPEVVRILRTFDPALPNDLAAFVGIRAARALGCRSVMTGDGGDELFAGYDYMLALDLKNYIPRLARTMSFSSNALGRALSIEVKQPYLDKRFVEFAIGIDPSLKVKEKDGIIWGKHILRKAYEGLMLKDILWRRKMALEIGSGFAGLREILEGKVSDEQFDEAKRRYRIKFRSKEHLFYYEIYRKEVGGIPEPKNGETGCGECGGGVPAHSRHCRICGGYPV
jgi:asparagine synthase (glutamine-hydrolysing)